MHTDREDGVVEWDIIDDEGTNGGTGSLEVYPPCWGLTS